MARWGWGNVESRKPVNNVWSLESLAIVDANVTALDTELGTEWLMSSTNVCSLNE